MSSGLRSTQYSLVLCAAVMLHCMLALQPLHLLVILPLDSSTAPGATDSWERGTQLLAAAERAVESINRNTSILQGYKLEVNSVSCAPQHTTAATLPGLLNATLQHSSVLAAVGMFCPNSARLIVKLARQADKERLTFPIFIGSPSPAIAVDTASNHFRMLDSSKSFAQAVVAFMEYQHWARVAVITDLDDTYYLQTAETFLKHIKQLKHRHQTNISVSLYLQARDSVRLEGFDARVVLVSASLAVSRQVISKASERAWRWPTHAWMFHTHSVDDLAINSSSIPGVFLFQDSLVEGQREHLNHNGNECCQTNNPYANTLHKTIILSALLKQMTLLETGLTYRSALKRINSSGLIDGLAFNEDTRTLFSSNEVRISQVVRSKNQTKLTGIGYYHSRQGHLNISSERVRENHIPPSAVFRSRELLISAAYFVEIILCFVLVTFNLVLYIHYRKEPEVKATSFSVSISMFLVCYVLILYLVIVVVWEEASAKLTASVSNALCLARSWLNILSIPGTFIVGTVLIKMLRVYTIFQPNNFRRIGKCYSDPAVFIYIILFQIPSILISVIWSVHDPYKSRTILTQETNFIYIAKECYSTHLSLWPSLLLCYNCLLSTVLVIVAVKTRKIRKTHFKDTKKVNLFVFFYLYLSTLLLSLWMAGRNLQNVTYSDAVLSIGHTCAILLVQATLFMPKLYPRLLRALRQQRRRGVETSSQSSIGYVFSTSYTNSSQVQSIKTL